MHSRFLAIALCGLAACAAPTAPTSTSYAGEWSGTTAQGRPLVFTISPAEAVTTITVGHEFNGCSGSQTFSGLSLNIAPQIQCIPGPCSPSLLSYRGFGYGSGNSVEGPSTAVNAVFLSSARAEGTVNFRNYPGCGDAIGVSWTATRR